MKNWWPFDLVMDDWKPSDYSNDFSSFSSYININIKDKELVAVQSGHGQLEAVILSLQEKNGSVPTEFQLNFVDSTC